MEQPPGFEEKSNKRIVCKLKISLYGLKQSHRAWFKRFGKVVKSNGYTQSQADHTMYFKHYNEGKISILIVYMDEIIVTSDDPLEIKRLKMLLARDFEIKDLEALKYFLGKEFARSMKGMFVFQTKFVLDLLKEIGLMGCKDAETPIESNLKLQPTKVEDVLDIDRFP